MRGAIALIRMLSLLPAIAQPVQVPARAKSAAQPVQADGGWPRTYETPTRATVVVYTPQIASWDNQKHMVLYSAVAYTPTIATMPVFGTVRAEADTKVALDERLVELSVVKITDANFSSLPKEQVQEIVEQITSGIPQHERVIALDRVLASVDTSQIIPKHTEGLKADPPTIFFSKAPAILLNIDSDPVWSPIPNNELDYAVNTNWDLFKYSPTKTLYLRNQYVWLQAPSLNGPWTSVTMLPENFNRLPADDDWKDVRAAIAARPGATLTTPKVFVSTKPAELILLRGEPKYAPVAGTKLMWVSNTDSDIFRSGMNGTVYYLVSGRWFSAPDFSGPWTFATPNLPVDFKNIPIEHPRSRVLASVPGTPQATEAVLLAGIPQTARVNKKDLKAPDVAYDGKPTFQRIGSTSLSYAVNTDKDIIKAGESYYMCFQGVWFMSSSPSGPWEVTGSVPPEVYEIPADSPIHNVTYVTVEESSDDWVEYAATAAYTGMMVGWGVAVWGDGYYYPPYIGYAGLHPIYYPHYPTYGYGARYNPWTGTYSRGVAAYGPYGGAGVGARYNPTTGRYSRGAAAYGPAGARFAAQGYNPRTGVYGATRQGAGVYGNWGTSAVQRGDQWAQSAHVTSNVTGNRTGVARTSGGDVYAGRDGNVYRKQGQSWQKYDNGSWNSVGQGAGTAREKTSSTMGQLNRDSTSRFEGAQRTQDFGSARSGGFQSGSFRSGGFGGGGFRRFDGQ